MSESFETDDDSVESQDSEDVEESDEEMDLLLAPLATWARPVASAAVSIRLLNISPGRASSREVVRSPKSVAEGATKFFGRGNL